jgi:AAA+ ATPase superfamily predicted ATPase
MENPFEFGRELGADELVDRQEEVAEVIRVIKSGEKLFVIGPRRYGKTSILKAADDRAARDGAVVLRYNAESYPTLDQLVAVIVADAARAMRGGVERAGEQIRKFFSKLRPELNFNVTESAWTATLGVAGDAAQLEGATDVGLLVDALDGLEKLAAAQPAGQPVGLVIDEFQRIIEIGGQDAERQIRSAIQRHKRTGYVFAGSKTRMLTDMTTDAARPFYRLGSLRFVGPVPRAEFIQFLLGKFSSGGFKVEGATGKGAAGGGVALILDLAEEVPYNVQLLAHTCWEQLSGAARGERVLTEQVVRASLERIARRYDPFYTQLWRGLTAVQQQTLVAVIKEGGVQMLSANTARAVGRGASTVAKSLSALGNREILREEESAGDIRYRFEDPFFAVWIEFLPRKFR